MIYGLYITLWNYSVDSLLKKLIMFLSNTLVLPGFDMKILKINTVFSNACEKL